MSERRLAAAAARFASAAWLLLAARASGQECVEWRLDDPLDFDLHHVMIGIDGASLEKNRRIGDEWDDVSLPLNAPDSKVYDIEQFSDGCLYATGVRPVPGPFFGNVCKSCDGGATWSCAELTAPPDRRCTNVSRLYQASDGVIYAAGYDDSSTLQNSGVWRSFDDGATWSLMHALPGKGCTSIVEAADGAILASTRNYGSVWRCADPVGAPATWVEVFQTPYIHWGGAPATYPSYPPPVLPACLYLFNNYGEHCGGWPYTSYPDPYRPDRTQSLFRADDGTLFVSTNSGSGSIWSGATAVRNFGHVYLSADNGLTWQDSGSWNPPPAADMNYWGYWNGSAWVQHTHWDGSHAADPVPTMQSFPTWVDRIWQDRAGAIYALTSSGDPLRSWMLDPRPDGIVFVYDRDGQTWDALGNLPGTGAWPGTDSYSQYNALYCHDIAEDEISGDLYTVTSPQALVIRSSDGGVTWDWFTSPRTIFGKQASGDFYSMELTCNSCLYVGYHANGEIYASRAGYHADGYLQNVHGFGHSGPLTLFEETTSSGSLGTITYWISGDGSAWYWWNGAGWTQTTVPAESNPATVINAHIGSFPSNGNFFFRAFLHPATVNGCPKTPHLLSVRACAQKAPPTPTPTPTPAYTPTPAPTPCWCDEPVVDVTPRMLFAGDVFTVSVCVPVAFPKPVDVYVVIVTPDGQEWSILGDGTARMGRFPLARGYTNEECWCGPVLRHTVCEGALPGEYTVFLAFMPAGMPPDVRKVLGIAWVHAEVFP